MSLGFKKESELEREIDNSQSSDHEPVTPEQPPEITVVATGNKIGTSIKPETVKEEVEIAKIVEPEIAKDAQAKLDEEKKANDDAEIQAQAHLAEQQAHKPAEVRRQEASLAEAKDKLRQGETQEEHEARLRNEERLRRQAQHAAQYVAEQLAEEAASKIAPKLGGIEEKAQEALDKRNQELAKLADEAALHKKQNEAHAAEVEKKTQQAQAKQHEDDLIFTQGDGQSHGVKPSASSIQVEKLLQLQAQLEANDPTVGTKPPKKLSVLEQAAKIQSGELAASSKLNVEEKPAPTKSNVQGLLASFTKKREEAEALPVKQEPRRSGRISLLVEEREKAAKEANEAKRVIKPKAKALGKRPSEAVETKTKSRAKKR